MSTQLRGPLRRARFERAARVGLGSILVLGVVTTAGSLYGLNAFALLKDEVAEHSRDFVATEGLRVAAARAALLRATGSPQPVVVEAERDIGRRLEHLDEVVEGAAGHALVARAKEHLAAGEYDALQRSLDELGGYEEALLAAAHDGARESETRAVVALLAAAAVAIATALLVAIRARRIQTAVQRETEEAVAAREALVSTVAHELKGPLQGVLLNLDLLMHSDRPDDPDEDRIRRVKREIHRVGRLVDDLLDVSRLESGRADLVLERVDLVELVEEIVARDAELLARARCPVTIEAPAPVSGLWDRLRLDQVVTNLINNAAKYGAGRPIVVTIGSHEGRARLSVRDQGIGMTAEDARELFQPFRRTKAARQHPGTGLGLWIVKQILEAQGGTIAVASSPGEGATFTVEVPLTRLAVAA